MLIGLASQTRASGALVDRVAFAWGMILRCTDVCHVPFFCATHRNHRRPRPHSRPFEPSTLSHRRSLIRLRLVDGLRGFSLSLLVQLQRQALNGRDGSSQDR
jgi:hypothetical protein